MPPTLCRQDIFAISQFHLKAGMDITGSVLAQRNRALVGGDYNSYHAQTARRIHAIRKRLGVTTRRGQKFVSRGGVTPADIAKNSEYVPLEKRIRFPTDISKMGATTSDQLRAIMDKCYGNEVRTISGKYTEAYAGIYKKSDGIETQQSCQIRRESC